MRKSALIFLAVITTAAHAKEFSAEELATHTIERRAVQAGSGLNQIIYWSGLSDWKNQTLTPNPDPIYFKPFFDTKQAGPIVLEVPPAGDDGSITSTIMDVWQAALEDVRPAGIDKGTGGKSLILPPGYAEPIPEGYIALPSFTYESFALLRSVLKTGVKQAVETMA